VRLVRRGVARATISLVPLVDVLLIMLVFFMVTSTYLDLDVIPAAERGDEEAPAAATVPGQGVGMLLIRLAPDGRTWLRGRALDSAEMRAALALHLRDAPGAAVSVLASPRADVQALVSLMDTATEAGVTRLRILRTEEAP
jgi:biopolymer transport protein ExbD